MKTNKLFFVIAFVISAFLFAEMAAHANEPIRVLQQKNSGSYRNISAND